jgi:hypothetical protein
VCRVARSEADKRQDASAVAWLARLTYPPWSIGALDGAGFHTSEMLRQWTVGGLTHEYRRSTLVSVQQSGTGRSVQGGREGRGPKVGTMRDDRDQDDGAGWNNLAADDLAEAERAVDDLAANDRAEGDFERAQFPIRLNLPAADEVPLEEAQEAVRREYRDAVIWKRMRCRKVERLSESETGTVFVLEVGHAVEFDWTWEGATAFRPLLLNEFATEQASFEDDSNERSNVADSVLWSGEVLEVDEAAGRIYVCVADPELPPTTGTFFVRPFEFLACLQSLFNEPAFERLRELLPERLLAAEGRVHPAVERFSAVGLTQLREWWGKAWSVLWGPPGTGKTYTTGQQVAQVLSDPSERILVVSTTNRATDAVALAVGRAAKSNSERRTAEWFLAADRQRGLVAKVRGRRPGGDAARYGSGVSRPDR